MRSSLFVFLILGFQVAFHSHGQEHISSNVNHVIIYSNQAQVFRSASVSLKEGENQIALVNLEGNILNNSIKVNAGSDATVLSQQTRLLEVSDAHQNSISKSLLEQIKQKERNSYLLQQKINNLKEEKQVILYNKQATGEGEGFNAAKLEGLANFYRKSLNQIDQEIYDYEQEVKVIRKEIDKSKEKLRASGYREEANAIIVSILSPTDKKIELKLNYVAQQVGWSPLYDIKTDGTSPTLDAVYSARIHQNTGVNWNNIPVTLSTATPLINQRVPTVHPWVLRFQQENLKYKKLEEMARSNRDDELQEVQIVSKGSRLISQDELTTAIDNITSREFKVNTPLTISGNDGKSVIQIDRYELDAAYQYYAVPKYNSNVFLTTYLTNFEKYNLLPGEANLYLGNDFVGTTFIHPNQDSDSLQLPLGKDDGVFIKRDRITDKTSRSFIGRNKTVDMGMQIVVRNNKNVPITLTLKDQVPISSHSDIEVTVQSIENAQHDEKTGTLTWELSLDPGETQKVEIMYSVKYPKNMRIANF